MINQLKAELIKAVDQVISRNLNKKRRTCPCGCGKDFTPSSSAHFFSSSSCYSKFHRIPGMFRKRMKEITD